MGAAWQGETLRGRHSLQGLIPRVSSEAGVALQGRPLCPHVDQSRVAPGRTAEGVSGKGYVPADNVGVLQSRRVVKLVDRCHSGTQRIPGWLPRVVLQQAGRVGGRPFRDTVQKGHTSPLHRPPARTQARGCFCLLGDAC